MMLKIIGRIVIILLVAGLIAGGMYLWVNHSGTSLASGLRGGILGGFAPGGDFHGDGDFGGGFQLQRALTDMTSKLGIILMITAAVGLVQKASGLISRKRILSRP